MSIGATIEHCIKTQGLKKYKVAERAEIRNSRLSKIMHDREEPDAKEIKSICNVLGVTPNYLFGWPEDGAKEEANESI